ncbi:reverse transcriptase domain-containing protein [Tanacetum coccineum]
MPWAVSFRIPKEPKFMDLGRKPKLPSQFNAFKNAVFTSFVVNPVMFYGLTETYCKKFLDSSQVLWHGPENEEFGSGANTLTNGSCSSYAAQGFYFKRICSGVDTDGAGWIMNGGGNCEGPFVVGFCNLPVMVRISNKKKPTVCFSFQCCHRSLSCLCCGSERPMLSIYYATTNEPETVQAMIDQALQRNSTNTHDDESQNSGRGPGRPVGCAIDNQVKFATCTLLGVELTWWNGHVRTLGHDAAYVMTWEILKKKLTDKYCPKGEINILEIELWNLKVKGNDVGGYTQRFQELALMCTKFLFDKTKKTLDDAIELANDLMDQKLSTYVERQAENKRKLDDNNQAQQQLLKKQNVVQAYVVGSGEKKPYGGSKPLCPKCNYHHDRECAPKCTNCKKVSHLTKDCWHPINANNRRTITCYECGNQGHYRSDCPVLKNQGTEARGMVYALGGGGETDQDINNMEDDINA